ncbi:hypothetical protein [Paenibacillus lignilyticus]|uniref:Uncharacterized protein n=1 Tax=Paenibacillus lignilyticus TaxID=1172615 RepID=A0ABS5C7B1_9BACL|nr:hypothetical protein [Paenibacillus lignilyticus]MBP3961883.1 hypothetical protein [Paenibacillus lignilyticus]
MVQHTNTYTIEKLGQYQQAELEQNLRRGFLIHSAEGVDVQTQAEQANKERGWLHRWWNKRRFGTSVK